MVVCGIGIDDAERRGRISRIAKEDAEIVVANGDVVWHGAFSPASDEGESVSDGMHVVKVLASAVRSPMAQDYYARAVLLVLGDIVG